MAGRDLLICHKCGGILMVDGTDKVRHDLHQLLGVESLERGYVLTYSCESCGISFTEHETDPNDDDFGPEYGTNLTELIFD